MSYMLPHLDSGYAVDQAILSEEERVVVLRFGHDWDPVSLRPFSLTLPHKFQTHLTTPCQSPLPPSAGTRAGVT